MTEENSTPKKLRIKIVSADADMASHTVITDADTGEPVTRIESFTMSVSVYSPFVEAVLTRLKTDENDEIIADYEARDVVRYEQTVEVVEAAIEAYEAE
jgi:hypothetical protein